MKRFFKFLGISLAALVGLCVILVGGLYAWSAQELRAVVASPAHGFAAPTDSASVAHGAHVMRVLAKCVDCHGPDMGGAPLVEDGAFGHIYAANLTRGRGGLLAEYSDADLEAAIRHGVSRTGRRLMIMPSNEYQAMSDEDLGRVIAYLRSLPPVDRELPAQSVGPIARGLFAAGVLPLLPGEFVTHGAEVVAAVAADTTLEYGKYLGAVGCAGCHGATFGGGKIPGAPPDFPPPANLTPTGIGHYTYPDFVKALTEGVRPDGTALDPFMPVAATKEMTPVEMAAVWKYLRTLPAREYGSR